MGQPFILCGLGRVGWHVLEYLQSTGLPVVVIDTRCLANDPRLKGAYRYEQGGWVYVHLGGDPANLGFQHGFLLAPEISDAFPAISTNMTHSTKRDWTFFRQTAREMLWPKIDTEYQQEQTEKTEPGLRQQPESRGTKNSSRKGAKTQRK